MLKDRERRDAGMSGTNKISLSRFTHRSVLTESPAEHKADPNCSKGGYKDGKMGGWEHRARKCYNFCLICSCTLSLALFPSSPSASIKCTCS